MRREALSAVTRPTASATRIVVFSGTGRYSDPWHPFDVTSAAIADTLREVGHEVEVRPSEPASLTDLTGVDLVVVNAGGGDPAVEVVRTPEWDAAHASLAAFMHAGGPVLGVHTATNTFPEWPEWPGLLGGRWIRGTSWHPPLDTATFEPVPDAAAHPVFAGLTEVVCDDERYCDQTLAPDATPLLRQATDGVFHTCGWALGDTVAYDGMGHDGRSYESPSRRAYLVNEVDWLLRGVRWLTADA